MIARYVDGKVAYYYMTPTNIEEAKTLLKLERQLRSSEGGFFTNGKWFHSDQSSRTQQIGLVLMGLNVPPVMWKTMDGTFVQMTPTLAQSIFQTAAQTDAQIFQICETKIAQVSQLDPASISTYEYFSGWPTAFWERQV